MNHERKPTLLTARLIAFALYALLVAAVVYFSTGGLTYGHSWYDRDCCDDQDCRPAQPDEVQVTPTGFLVTVTIDGLTATKHFKKDESTVRFSPDGKFHVCIRRYGAAITFYCLYVPGGGV